MSSMLGLSIVYFRGIMERRESEHKCPKCGEQLYENWDMVSDGGLVPRMEVQRIGRPRCPKGHAITEWTMTGQPIFAK